MHYYHHNIGDYARDTSHLTVIEHGIYRLLLDWYYLNEKPITTEKALRLGRGYPNETQSVLSEFFSVSDEGWRHCRVEAELELYRKKAEVNRENGLKGGRPKTQNNPVGSQSGGEQNPNVTLTNNQEPITINQKSPKKNTSSASADFSPAFLQFWDSYPKKVAKPDAWKSWRSRKLDEHLDQILQNIAARKERDQGWEELKFTPNPTTFLNQERWKDPVPERRAAPARPPSRHEQGMNAIMELRNELMVGGRSKQGHSEAVRPVIGWNPVVRDDSGNDHGLDRND